MLLSFKDGQFRIRSRDIVREALPLEWTCGYPGLYETRSLRAAAVYKQFADADVKAIFDRTFQDFYILPAGLPLPSELDPHQREGVEWILSRKRSYLAHAPGAGKTAQAIVAMMCAGTCRDLIIAPPSLVKNWEREIYKVTDWFDWFPTIGIVGSSENQDRVAWGADFIICPDSMLTKPWVYRKLLEMDPDFIVVDEASRFKDPLAKRTGALFGSDTYPGLTQTPRHVVLMDGSPMPNRPIELWAPIYAMDPESIDCMSYEEFGHRYCGARQNEYGHYLFDGSNNEKELKSKLAQGFMHVVTESQLSHPERLRSMLFMDKDVRSSEQKTWERKHLDQIKEFSDGITQGDMARFRQELGMKKVPFIAKYVAERLKDKNESILLFAWHRDVIDDLAYELRNFNPGVVLGGTPSGIREIYFQKFQEGQTKLLIMNIASGGRGHNLQNADRVIFGEFAWTDETNKQAEKRASRRGSTKSFVRCEYIVAPHSMDEKVLSSLFTKEKRVKRVIG